MQGQHNDWSTEHSIITESCSGQQAKKLITTAAVGRLQPKDR